MGVLIVLNASAVWIAVGVWLIGVGANYVPLAREAHRLSRPGVLEVEMARRDPARELRRAARDQLWIAVPFAIAVVTTFSTRKHRAG